jgi:hypothetical protein
VKCEEGKNYAPVANPHMKSLGNFGVSEAAMVVDVQGDEGTKVGK